MQNKKIKGLPLNFNKQSVKDSFIDYEAKEEVIKRFDKHLSVEECYKDVDKDLRPKFKAPENYKSHWEKIDEDIK